MPSDCAAAPCGGSCAASAGPAPRPPPPAPAPAALPVFFAGPGATAPAAERALDAGTGGAEGGPEFSLAPFAAPTEAPLAPGADGGKTVLGTATQATKIEEAPAAPAPDPALLIGAGLVALAGAVLIVRAVARRATEDPLP